MTHPPSDHTALLEDSPAGEWVPDPLPGCSRRTLPLGEDEEGPFCATLVRFEDHPEPEEPEGGSQPKAPVLQLHGWSDYFYNLPLARLWAEQGHPFYALDLRRYGRSLREGQTPGYVEDLTHYDADLEAALGVIAEEHPEAPRPIIQGHSTGGLIAALWAERHPDRAGVLVLNSPWLEVPGDAAARTALEGLLTPLSHLSPKRAMKLPVMDNYWQSLSDQAHGEWSLHPRWRPRNSFPMTSGWLKAVLAGHRAIHDGLHLRMPVLVLLSAATKYQRHWTEELLEHDSVLDVDLLARRAMKLGRRVTVVRLRRALHDVFASEATVRQEAFEEVSRWLRAYAPD